MPCIARRKILIPKIKEPVLQIRLERDCAGALFPERESNKRDCFQQFRT
jgi:hypothetical protein